MPNTTSPAALGPCPVTLDPRVDGELVRINESATRLAIAGIDAIGSRPPHDARSAAVRVWHLALGALCVSLGRAILTEILHQNARAVDPLHRSLVEHLIRLKYFQLDNAEAEYQLINRPADFLGLVRELGITGPGADQIAADAAAAKAKLPKGWSEKSIKKMVEALEGSKSAGTAAYAHIYRWPSQGSHATTVGISAVFDQGESGGSQIDIFGEKTDPNEILARTTAATIMLAQALNDYYSLDNATEIAKLTTALDAVDDRLGLRNA